MNTTSNTIYKAKVKYVVYELKPLLNSNYEALQKITFDGWRSNGFETEDQAIQALIEDKLSYMEYVILKTVIIIND